MTIRNNKEEELIRQSGNRLAAVMGQLGAMIAPGVALADLDRKAQQLITASGDRAAFLNYQPEGAPYPFPAAVCVSVNEEVVHGIPQKDEVFSKGDVVTLDLGLVHEGFITDMARTFVVGAVDGKTKKLMNTTRSALDAGIAEAYAGNTVGDIGHAIEKTVKGAGFSIVRILGGHGVGREVHEEPFIPNFGNPGEGPKLKAGMVLALEPIVVEGKGAVSLADDGYTYFTKDGSRAAHFEDTILITESGPAEVLTKQ